FYVSFSYNNHGNDFDTGIYKYTVNAGLEGVLLNEKLDISYTFVQPIKPDRSDNIDKDERKKARENGTLDLKLSFPIGITETSINYSRSDYKRSVITLAEEIFDLIGSTDNVGIESKITVYRKKDKKVKLINEYSYSYKKSKLEDAQIEKSHTHTIKNGIEYTDSVVQFKNIMTNVIDNKLKHSIAYDGNLEYSYKNSKFILNSHIAKRDFSLETKAKLTYKMLYSELGVKYDYPNKVYPVIG
ncbi:ShlB/FhaC/HecB family hemolysin secretion/activation protein, partial [Oceanivirga salmonicida]|uniref:ShlB/FhaC/HecB family hemolysin secretion/activation protein n=1 Tax=Oceanivirga salmonicida TaxID=1769291 RepID=UPI0018CC0F42